MGPTTKQCLQGVASKKKIRGGVHIPFVESATQRKRPFHRCRGHGSGRGSRYRGSRVLRRRKPKSRVGETRGRLVKFVQEGGRLKWRPGGKDMTREPSIGGKGKTSPRTTTSV